MNDGMKTGLWIWLLVVVLAWVAEIAAPPDLEPGIRVVALALTVIWCLLVGIRGWVTRWR